MRVSHFLTLSLALTGSLGLLTTTSVPGAAGLGLTSTASAQEGNYGPPGQADIDTFYDQLAPYGAWVQNPEYGYVWVPSQVSPDWRPYTVGQWVDTDDGWYWDSPEPFAWAVYHYGRWSYDNYYGWYWVPGDTWSPAWVEWRYGDQYVGWAPVAPYHAGYAYGRPDQWNPPVAESWVFVQPRYFGQANISAYALPIGNLMLGFNNANQVYRPSYRDGRMYNYGVPRNFIAQRTGRPVVTINLFRSDKYYGGGNRYQQRDNNRLYIYAPGIRKGQNPGGRPKHFVTDPSQFQPKAKLRDHVKGEPPKGWGRPASDSKSGFGKGSGNGPGGNGPNGKGPGGNGPGGNGPGGNGPNGKGPGGKSPGSKGPGSGGSDNWDKNGGKPGGGPNAVPNGGPNGEHKGRPSGSGDWDKNGGKAGGGPNAGPSGDHKGRPAGSNDWNKKGGNGQGSGQGAGQGSGGQGSGGPGGSSNFDRNGGKQGGGKGPYGSNPDVKQGKPKQGGQDRNDRERGQYGDQGNQGGRGNYGKPGDHGKSGDHGKAGGPDKKKDNGRDDDGKKKKDHDQD